MCMGLTVSYWVYIVTNRKDGVLYTGVAGDLVRRIWQHRQGEADGFTKQYNLKRLVWFETHLDVTEAIRREKQIKRWRRDWKIELIEKDNPDWDDLFEALAR